MSEKKDYLCLECYAMQTALYSAIHRLTCIQIIQFDILEAIDYDVLFERRTVRDEYRLQTKHVSIFRKIAGNAENAVLSLYLPTGKIETV